MFSTSNSVQLNINIPNIQNVFFSGQQVSGHIEIQATKARILKDLIMKVEGNGRVKWRKYDRKKEKRVNVVATENYYSQRFSLLNNQSNNLTLGSNTFPFSFIVPNNVPSSFESDIGYVRHTCKVIADIENKFFDVKDVVPFSVTSVYDLNNDPVAKMPIHLAKGKTLCCLWCKNGQISFNVNLDHSGFVPGEKLSINAECVNASINATCQATVKIIQKIEYKVRNERKTTTKTVTTKSHPAIPANETDDWGSDLFTVPLIPSQLSHCSLIHIQYFLKFTFSSSGAFSKNLEAETPIVIGTIPLRRLFSNTHTPTAFSQVYGPQQPILPTSAFQPSAPNYFSSGNLEKNDLPPPYPWAELYPELPPPSYQECAEDFDRVDSSSEDDDQSGHKSSQVTKFMPRYVTYGWN